MMARRFDMIARLDTKILYSRVILVRGCTIFLRGETKRAFVEELLVKESWYWGSQHSTRIQEFPVGRKLKKLVSKDKIE